jgi:enediyne biosynthesis protein E4
MLMLTVVLMGFTSGTAIAAVTHERAVTEFVCAPATNALATGRAKSAQLSARRSAVPDHGVVSVITIFAQFQGESTDALAPAWASALFDRGRPGSFSHFYDTMSLGQLKIDGTVLPRRYSSDHGGSAYIAADPVSEGRYGEFAREILTAADADVDFGAFDNDGPDGEPNSGDDDGFVDYVFLNLRSTPQRFLIGRATGIAALGMEGDFNTADRAAGGGVIRISGTAGFGAIQRETSLAVAVGSMAHEFGHALGLPDLFDRSFLTDNSQAPAQDSAGIGHWGLMGWGATGWYGNDGPAPLSAWSRQRLGWLTTNNGRLVQVTGDTSDVVVQDVQTGGAIVRVPLPPEPSTRASVEQGYLLLEQRVRSSYYNRNQPQDGLLVWHVRPSRRDNNDESGKLVDLVCADGSFTDAGFPLGRAPAPHGGRDNLDFWAHDLTYARGHTGNRGDATDVFDGVRFQRLDLTSNPSGVPTPALVGATGGTTLSRIQRSGETSIVDVSLPRWSGKIHNEVRWIGEILVDGDLELLPGGALIVYPGTQVRFAASDRLQAGRDPSRCELIIRGTFDVQIDLANRFGSKQTPAVFASEPGGSWYGIIADPSASGQIRVPEDALELRDAVQGIALPGAPEGVSGLVVTNIEILDSAGPERAGNGDGVLNPGETFSVAVRMNNWSLSLYDDVRGELSWDTTQLRPRKLAAHAIAPSSLQIEPAAVYPGQGRLLALPSLTLSPTVSAGDSVEVAVRLRAGSEVIKRVLKLPVHGHLPRNVVDLTVSQSDMGDSLAVAGAERPLLVSAQVSAGAVLGVDLIAQDRTTGVSILDTPMRRTSVGPSGALFSSATAQLPTGDYQLGVRLRSVSGAVFFHSVTERLLTIPDPGEYQVLLLLESATVRERDSIRSRLGNALKGTELKLALPPASAFEEGVLAELLRVYRNAGRIVLWGGATAPAARQQLLRDHILAGGRILFVSPSLHQTPAFDVALRAAVGIGEVLRTTFSQLALSGETAASSTATRTLFRELVPAATAQVLAADASTRVAGTLARSGLGAGAYLSFDLRTVTRPQVAELVAGALSRLHSQMVSPVPVDPGPPTAFETIRLPGDIRFGNGAGLFDTDGDGDLDLYLVRLGARDRLFRNDGGIFVDATEFAGIDGSGRGRGLAVGDYDADGDLDIYLVNEGANRLWASDGAGHYHDETFAVNVSGARDLADTGSGRSAAFFDGDADGDLDLYVVNATGENRFYERHEDSFIERAAQRGLADRGSGRGLAVGDYDGDGDTDLLVANAVGPSLILGNRRGYFSPVESALGLALPGGEVAAVFGDYDNDGDPDLFVSNERLKNQLLRNDGNGVFTPVLGGASLGGQSVGAAFGDYDNDGDLDLATTSLTAAGGGDQLFENRGGGWFSPMGETHGLTRRSEGRAVVMADVDGDGQQDLAVADYAGSRLYRNRLNANTEDGRWLQLQLQGSGGNLDGLGARVELRIGDATQTREAQSGYGYGSQVQPRLHFGVGEATRVDEVTVTWPDGSVRSWHGVATNRLLALAHEQSLPGARRPLAGEASTDELELLPAWPNPSNAGVMIAFRLPADGPVTVAVHDILGQRVRQLLREERATGVQRLFWDGRDDGGLAVGSGAYVIRLRAAGDTRSMRIMLVK